MNTKEKNLVEKSLWDDAELTLEERIHNIPDGTKNADDVHSDPVTAVKGAVHIKDEEGEADDRKPVVEPVRSSHRSALAVEREKLMRMALDNGGISLKGGTLFRYRTPGGEARVGFAVTGQTESDVRAASAIYERMCNPYLGFTPYEGVIRLNDCYVYSFQLYGDCESVYNEVCNNRENPELEVIDSNRLLKQLAQIVFSHHSVCGNTYVPLDCISPHTVFVQRSVPDAPRVVILPIVAPRSSTERVPEMPNDAKLDITSDLYAVSMLVCEVWSGGFLCDGHCVNCPTGTDNELLRNALSSLPTSRPTMQEFAARLDLVRIPIVTPTVKKSAGKGKSFLEWLGGLFPALKAWMKDSDLIKGRDSTFREGE